MTKRLFALFLVCAALTSCIQDEPLNSECDIETCRVVMDDPLAVFYSESDAVTSVLSVDTIIAFSTRENANRDLLKSVALELQITPGATVVPASGSVQDFSGEGVRYTVTSQDGRWKRTYLVRFVPKESLNPKFDFENVELEPNKQKYYQWFAYDNSGARQDLWATGNSGFALSRSSAKPMEYPTIPWEDVVNVYDDQGNPVSKKSVKLETCDTGGFGAMVNMRLAAGNLFLGTFDTANALVDAMAATRFGVPVNRFPVRFRGYYKFKPGARFQDRAGKTVEGVVDAPDAYAVLYRNTDKDGNPVILKGDDVLTHANIVAMARVENFLHTGVEQGDPWKYFDLKLEYKEDKNYELLYNYGYNLTVVFSSSVKGAEFEGAVGSIFLVDEAEIVFE